ncbi:MAG: DUF975 family protein [Eubacteriales bacterium]|nr:DUF975 family protein [Eubacteriales bacterium]MDD3198292.1 DUF975 family protein [Eubacteriales bacterium]MDD3504450.1 DUF975 family protein [Eubacteriales bacterium]
MWRRSELKDQAKFHLKGKYWMAFLVTIIAGLLAGEGGGSGVGSSFNSLNRPGGNANGNFNYGNGSMFFDGQLLEELNWFLNSPMFQIIIAFVIAAIFFGIAYQIFVAAPIRVGSMRWFSRSRETEGTPSISQMFSLFRSGRYMGSVSGMLWRGLWLWIWSTLSSLPILAASVYFVIYSNMIVINRQGNGFSVDLNMDSTAGVAGILVLTAGIILSTVLSIIVVVKSYSYHLVPWILADNPAIGARRALTLSKTLTRGNKFEMFVLDLSFIGWYLLGLLLCCVGVIFVTPYYTATHTELYAVLRDEGVRHGDVTMEELGYKRVQQPEIQQPVYNTAYNNEYNNFSASNNNGSGGENEENNGSEI